MPCGAMAHALFNDTIKFVAKGLNLYNFQIDYVPLIASDKKKFKNPHIPEGKTFEDVLKPFSKPKYWKNGISEFDKKEKYNGVLYPPFVNWISVSPFKKFYKPLYILSGKGEGSNMLSPGNYEFTILYNYPVKSTSSRKFVSISQTSPFGTRNPFLLYSSLVACILTGTVVLLGIIQGSVRIFKSRTRYRGTYANTN
ncbi:Cell cycle control protein 50A [Thelohanellus kitauei]|uniref:Cell cycle control protein 50A n=1 Tax=Thelohanellus kitauei TaxID=669202 RepID=A0A0C2MVZ8_THEKT|nr:Cell cycle control protein 50A [Thelohanellus kitauei]